MGASFRLFAKNKHVPIRVCFTMEQPQFKFSARENPHAALAFWNDKDMNHYNDIQGVGLDVYGIDDFEDADFSDLNNNVEVPAFEFSPNEVRMQQLNEQIHPLEDDGNFGVNHFINTTFRT